MLHAERTDALRQTKGRADEDKMLQIHHGEIPKW